MKVYEKLVHHTLHEIMGTEAYDARGEWNIEAIKDVLVSWMAGHINKRAVIDLIAIHYLDQLTLTAVMTQLEEYVPHKCCSCRNFTRSSDTAVESPS